MKFDDHQKRLNKVLEVIRIAKLAFAYQQLGKFAERIAKAGLRGKVVLRGENPGGDQPRSVLIAHGFSQSVIEEHFLQEEITVLHAVLAYVNQADPIYEMRFRLEDIGAVYFPAFRLAEALARKGLAACGEADDVAPE